MLCLRSQSKSAPSVKLYYEILSAILFQADRFEVFPFVLPFPLTAMLPHTVRELLHAPGWLGVAHQRAGRLGVVRVEDTQGGISRGRFRGILHPFADVLYAVPEVITAHACHETTHQRTIRIACERQTSPA
jgi:hypothetical protein